MTKQSIHRVQPERAFDSLVVGVARLWGRLYGMETIPLGLSHAQLRVLRCLLCGASLTQASIAEHLGIAPISVGRLIDRMETGGWVVRSAACDDRRAHRIHATQQAQAIFFAADDVAERVTLSALEGLTNAECVALTTLLMRVHANLR